MAYQIRVVIDRIRFAIKQAEQPHLKPEQTREIALQLVDALDRLESAERDFQLRFHGHAEDDLTLRNLDGDGSKN
jgi:hypothetical protein